MANKSLPPAVMAACPSHAEQAAVQTALDTGAATAAEMEALAAGPDWSKWLKILMALLAALQRNPPQAAAPPRHPKP